MKKLKTTPYKIFHIISVLAFSMFLVECTSEFENFFGDRDSEAPILTEFTLTSLNSTMNPAIFFDLNAADNNDVSGWMINETGTRPTVADPGWQGVKPVSYTLESTTVFEEKRVFAWAKNASGNISEPLWVYVEYTPDGVAPVLSTFSLTSDGITNDPIITFTLDGSDNSDYMQWIISESGTPPGADDLAWNSTIPTDYTLTGGSGSTNVYAWAIDPQGNISSSLSFTVDLDIDVPTISEFSLTSSNPTIIPDITFILSGTDNYAISGWMINESSTKPLAGDSGWVGTKPGEYTFADPGTNEIKTVYVWAKDAVGNVSESLSFTVDYQIDTDLPTVTDFTLTSGTPTYYPVVTYTLSGTDNIAVTGWMINESSTKPLAGDSGWAGTKPANYTFTDPETYEIKTVYAWAKDDMGNVSDSLSFTVEYQQDIIIPVVTEFILSSPDPTYVDNITFTLNGSDNSGIITGWIINESLTMPLAGDSGWIGTMPGTYTFADPGTYEIKTIYAWAKDAQGNVSNSLSFTVDYVDSDTTPPVINEFTLTSANPTRTANITFNLNGTDNVGITGWMIKQTPTTPLAGDGGWNGTKPSGFTLTGCGDSTLYAWAKDAEGNVSDSASFNVVNFSYYGITGNMVPSDTVRLSTAIAMNNEGPVCNIYIVYFTSNSLKMIKSTNCGCSWEAAVTIENIGIPSSSNGEWNCSMKMVPDRNSDGDDLYVSYFSSSNDDLKFAWSTNGGSGWSTKTADSSSTVQRRWNSIDVVPGTGPGLDAIYISYNDCDDDCGDGGEDDNALKIARSTDGGGSFSVSDLASSNDPMGYSTAVRAVDRGSDTVYVGSLDKDAGQIMFSRSTNGGSSWARSSMESDSSITYKSLTVIPGGDQSTDKLFMSYNRSSSLRLSKSLNGGASWTYSDVDTSGTVGQWTSITEDIGNIYVSYYDSGNLDLKFAKSIDEGVSWSIILTVDDTGNVGRATSIDAQIEDTFSYVVISYVDDSGYLMFTKSIDDGLTWE